MSPASREFAILTMYRKASPDQVTQGVAWYSTARTFAIRLARKYGVTKQCAAGVIAALSPQLSWVKNKEYAAVILSAASWDNQTMPKTKCILGNWRKAWRIATGAHPLTVLAGPKVTAFYRNICGKNDTSVTVDVWAYRVADPIPTVGLTPVQYRKIASAYQAVASALGIVPSQLQAICWIAIRGTGE
jgi:hypothetical protein